MRFRIIKNRTDPFYGRRANWYNVKFTEDIQKDLEKNYIREIHNRTGKQDMDIINCYENAGLAHELYACLEEDDDERMRQALQRLADEKLNQVVSILVDLGYTF